MSDDVGRRKPRPELLLQEPDPEFVLVREDESPITDRVPMPMPPPRKLPPKPPPRLDLRQGRQSSYVEFAAQINAIHSSIATITANQDTMLANQQQMARQTDHLGSIINQRFDIFHRELAMLRALVTGNHEPRLGAVEKATGIRRARTVAVAGGKYTGIVVAGAFLLRLIGKAYPQFAHLIESVLGSLGL